MTVHLFWHEDFIDIAFFKAFLLHLRIGFTKDECIQIPLFL